MWSLLCVPPLAAMAISDLRSRRIGTVHLTIFGITLLTASLMEFGWRQVLLNVVCNLLTVGVLWFSLYVYSRLRKLTLVEMMGGGDLAFALAVMPYFDLSGYVLYLVVSSVLTLTVWIVSRLGGKQCRDIPLVTGLGACLGAVILYRTIMI